ncbi:importin alpha 1 subunit-like protein, partial [Reticulomyxa filosa]
DPFLKKKKKNGRALTNIASGEREYTRRLADMGCVEGFVNLLKNSVDMETVDQAIWGLGNIAGDSSPLRDKVLHSGVVSYILKNLNELPEMMKRNAVWTLSNFCRGKPSPEWKAVSQILKPLADLLTNAKDYEVITDVLWAISFISEDRDEGVDERGKPRGKPLNLPDSFQIDAVIKTGIVSLVVNYIKHAARLRESVWDTIYK